jgi:dimethylamine monooxygenase subunit A
MGLRALDLAQWIDWGADAEGQIAEKATILREHFNEVALFTPGGDDACAELLREIRSNLQRFHAKTTAADAAVEHPLVTASRLVPEDLCVLRRTDGEWRLAAAVVCFPSRWSLATKIGRSLDVIHAPVPGYEEALASPTNRFFDRLREDKPFWRLNWTLLDDATLFQPSPSRDALIEDPAEWLFRVERQTLRQLPESGAIVFTIRTIVRPVRLLVELLPTFASDVYAVLASAPADTLAYKGWESLAPRWAERFALPS